MIHRSHLSLRIDSSKPLRQLAISTHDGLARALNLLIGEEW